MRRRCSLSFARNNEARSVSTQPDPVLLAPAVRFNVSEAAGILRISRAHLYVRIQQGAISVHKDGSRTFISRHELERYVRACEDRVVPNP
jgi:excisionase family DNA binding protein